VLGGEPKKPVFKMADHWTKEKELDFSRVCDNIVDRDIPRSFV